MSCEEVYVPKKASRKTNKPDESTPAAENAPNK
jgi:hypothetical protein